MSFACPKCGFQQERGAECLRCGVVFSRLETDARPRTVRPPAPRVEREPFLTSLGRVYRVFRWVLLGVLTLVLLLILRPDTPPPIEEAADAPLTLQRKLETVEREVSRGRPAELRVNEAELNAWMGRNLALAARSSTSSAPSGSAAPHGRSRSEEPSIDEVQSNVRDVKVQIEGDRVRGYVLFDLYGKKMSVTLEGYLSVRDGYLRLTPVAMKVGSMPIPRATVDRAVKQLFESPDNREQFRVPPGIGDIRVEDGVLVVAY